MNIAALDLHPTASGSDQLKLAMQRLAGGVVVVTAGVGQGRVGFTATSAVSLSVDPPTMLVCVNRASSTLPVIRALGHCCISILGQTMWPSPSASPAPAGCAAKTGSAASTG